MAVRFTHVSAFICERVLVEKDDVLSAVRIADVFPIPENPPEGFVIAFSLVLSAKIAPESEALQYNVKAILIRSNGERVELLREQSIPALRKFPDTLMPLSLAFAAQVALKPLNMGTAHIEIQIENEVAATVPLTLIPAQLVGLEPQK